MQSVIPPEFVYEAWFAHERKTRPNISPQDRMRLMTEELPHRAGWPTTWYGCTLEPERALILLVGTGWEGWTEWSRPEGTYLCVARKIIETDPHVPVETITRVRRIAADLVSKQSPVFGDDPVILNGRSVDGPFIVIVGHHRASAVSVAIIEGSAVGSFATFIGIVS